MAILFSNEILNSVKNELRLASDSVQIITAYCKEASLQYLDECINQNVKNKRLLVRFRMDDILKGSTDFSAVESALKNGWEVFVRFDLHAKTYIVDNKRGFIGSANVTNSGLSIGKNGNMEMATLIDMEPQDIEKIGNLFNGAIRVTAELIENMKKQLDAVNDKQYSENNHWDKTIMTLFNPRVETLFSYEMPEDFGLIEGEYFSFLDLVYTGDEEQLKLSLRWSNAYLWLIETLKENNGCIYFGELSAKLHDALVTDPKPYRREVKKMLANLLLLVETLKMEEIEIDRPNYSQRIRLKEK